jgi:hypothetical protein
MIKATAKLPDGRVLMVLGLSEGNVLRLKAGDPIYFDVGAMKLAPTDRLGAVTVFYGQDEAALANTIRDLIGPTTTIISVPRGDPRPQ